MLDTAHTIAGLGVALWVGAAIDTLHPTDYESPSGSFVLRVDPTTRSGAGEGHYTLSCDGREVWRRELRFTFQQAVVSDDGTSAGFAYTRGYHNFDGEFVVAILSPAGEFLLEEAAERTYGMGFHEDPDPKARGMFLQAELGRAVVRVTDPDPDRKSESWWSYDLAAGNLLSKIQPKSLLEDAEGLQVSLGASGVPGTPLTAVHWSQWKDRRNGCRFLLVDAAYRAVWQLDLPEDLESDGEEGWERLHRFREEGGILSVGPGSFEGRLAGPEQRVTWSVSREREGWIVEEIARSDCVPPERQPVRAAREVTLRHLATVELHGHGDLESNPIRDVVEFHVDAAGGVRFLRREKGKRLFTCLRLDGTGKVVEEATFGPLMPEARGQPLFTPLDESEWLVTFSPLREKARSTAAVFDVAGLGPRVLSTYSDGSVDAVASSPTGGFAVLATHGGAYKWSTLTACRGDGSRIWAVGADGEGPDALFSPEDVAVTTEGSVAVVDVIAKTVQVYDQNGVFVRSIDLEEAWSQEPNYPSDITADVDDGVIVHDFNGDPPFWRMSLDGSVRGTFRPRFADGRTSVELGRHIRVANGRLWTSDGSAFLRLDDEGVVDHMVGEAPSASLDKPGAAAIDPLGRALVQDLRTGSVHVFDPSGALQFVCEPDPTDFDDVTSMASLLVSGSGDVYAELEDGGFLQFAQNGDRIGRREFPVYEPRFRPGSDEYCGAVHEDLHWRTNGETVLTLSRHPDGRWLSPIEYALSRDGRLAIYDADDRESHRIVLFDGEGGCLKTIGLPEEVAGGSMIFSGRWIGLGNWGRETSLIDVEDESVYRVTAKLWKEERGSRTLAFSPDGRELWWLDPRKLQLHKYALPEREDR